MMSTIKDEVLAASIRKQIAYLQGLMEELNNEPEKTKTVLIRIKDVENKIRELRNKLSDSSLL